MSVKIRLQRNKGKMQSNYKIIVTDSRSPRDGKYIDILGTYVPYNDKQKQKHITLNINKVKYWLANGALMSEKVSGLFSKFAITKI